MIAFFRMFSYKPVVMNSLILVAPFKSAIFIFINMTIKQLSWI